MVSILWPSRGTYSTFVHAHLKHLPTKTQILYGGNFPRFYGDCEPLESRNLFYRIFRKIAVSVFKVPSDTFQKRGLIRFLVKNEVDVVLAEMPQIAAAVLPSVRAAQKPLVVYFRGNDPARDPELAKIPYSELFQYATAIFAVSRDLERQLLQLGAPPSKLFYNPSGVDVSIFRGGDPARTPPVFLCVGRFVDKKGPHLTLLAFKHVVDVLPDARLLMIGEGKLWESCKILAKALKVTGSVEFLGYQSHDQVAEIMGRVRAVVQHSVQTSYGAVEGTPCAIMEAGASGLPVVATKHAGIADVVIHGETGFLVEEGDIEGMARYMIRLASDPELAGRMGQASQKRIRSEFSLEKRINLLWLQIKDYVKP